MPDEVVECDGTWQEIPNLETEDTLLRCDGCGELWIPARGIHLTPPEAGTGGAK